MGKCGFAGNILTAKPREKELEVVLASRGKQASYRSKGRSGSSPKEQRGDSCSRKDQNGIATDTPMSLLQSFCGGHNSSVSGSCSATQSVCPGLSQTASTKTYGSLGMLKKRFYSAADVKDDFSTGYCSFPASLVRVVPQGSASAPSSSRLSAEFLRPLGRSCFLLRFVF